MYTVKYGFSKCTLDWIGIFIVYRHIRMPTSCLIALFGTHMILHSFIPAFIYYLKQSVRDHVKKQRPVCRRDISLVSNPPIGTSFGPWNITVIMSQESHYWNAFLIRIHFHILQNKAVMGHIIHRWKGMNEDIAAPLES